MEKTQILDVDTILQSIDDAVIAIDKKGIITFMNPAAKTRTGWEKTDALGRNSIDFVLVNKLVHNQSR